MRVHRPYVVAVLFMMLIFLALPASASDVRIVRLSLVEGDVLIDRNSGEGAEAALMNMPVVAGTRIYSDDTDARVEVEFENGSTLRLAGPGEILFRQLSTTGNGSKVTLAEIVDGLVYANIKLHDDDDFRLEFNGENISLRKSSRFRVEVDGPKTTLSVFKGEAQLQGHPGLVVVTKGETLTLDQDDLGRYALVHGIAPLDADAWDKSRNGYQDSYRNANAYSYAGSSYGGLYSYGVSDLAYYGAFGLVPGYGYLWQPYGIGSAWDPFMAGAWSYYPGSGWVFVSSTPWGWLPYRYGNWVYVPGYGWGWRPGPYSHWTGVPNVVGHPPRFNPPTPPHTNSGPTTLVGGGRPPRTIPHGSGGEFSGTGRPRPPRVGSGTVPSGSTGSGAVTGVTPGVSGRPAGPAGGSPVGVTNPSAATTPAMNPRLAPMRRGFNNDADAPNNRGSRPASTGGSNTGGSTAGSGRSSGSSGNSSGGGRWSPSGSASSSGGGGGSHSGGSSGGGGSHSGGSGGSSGSGGGGHSSGGGSSSSSGKSK